MFQVDWEELALTSLTTEWMKADSQLRAEITAATHEIEKYLSRTPDRAGESREPGTRILIVYPLAVTFHVNVRSGTVLISSVRVSSRRR